jgi:hypothetical protein
MAVIAKLFGINVAFESGVIALFGNATAPTGWTKKTDWQDSAMLCYTTGTPASGGSANPQSPHDHVIPPHDHAIPLGIGSVGDAYLFIDSTGYSGTSGFDIRMAYTETGTYSSKNLMTTSEVAEESVDPNTAPYYQEVIAATKD